MMKRFFKKISSKIALSHFLESMNISYIQWHDGIGYKLELLKKLERDEFKRVEALLISRKNQDWRDVEALAALNSFETIQALKECLKSEKNQIKLCAVDHLKKLNILDKTEEIILEVLPKASFLDGLSYVLFLAEKYPSELIKQKLLYCSLHGHDDIRVHSAALALFLYGKTSLNFDRNQKIIFEFRSEKYSKRLEAFVELCSQVGVAPSSLKQDVRMSVTE